MEHNRAQQCAVYVKNPKSGSVFKTVYVFLCIKVNLYHLFSTKYFASIFTKMTINGLIQGAMRTQIPFITETDKFVKDNGLASFGTVNWFSETCKNCVPLESGVIQRHIAITINQHNGHRMYKG